jgi:hypothetical protein
LNNHGIWVVAHYGLLDFVHLQHAYCASTLQAFMMILQFFLNTIDILHNKVKSSKKKVWVALFMTVFAFLWRKQVQFVQNNACHNAQNPVVP